MSGLPRNTVIVGDAREQLVQLPEASIDMVLTSPPYFRLRDFQISGQLGLEAEVTEWVEQLRLVCVELGRVLMPSGTLWLNLGDAFSTHARQGAPRKSLLLGPERLALALIADDWTLRSKIVWAKTNPMPSSARDRLSCTWEIIYLLTRSQSYFFDLDAIRVPHVSRVSKTPKTPPKDALPEAWRGPNADTASGLTQLKAAGLVGHPLGKNPGDVWRLATAGYRGGHYANFPRALAERAIRAGCPERRCTRCRAPWRRRTVRALGRTATRAALGPTCTCGAPYEPGIVLDPFMGAGTMAVAAESLRRDWLGVELNPNFAALTEQRLREMRRERPRDEAA